MRRLEFYYDFVCPYAYLASLRIEALAERVGVDVTYIPMLLGGVFRAIGSPDVPMHDVPASKAKYMKSALERAAEVDGVVLHEPANHPRRTVLALRAAIACDDLRAATHALFGAYWREGRDLENDAEVRAALDRAGLDGARAIRTASEQRIKDALRINTERAIDCGVFGAPSFFVTDDTRADLYWGNDRLAFVERALRASGEIEDRPSERPSAPAVAPEVDFYFDFSSPFAYLASTQIEAITARTGATIALKPVLLGGLFRSIGTPDVPLFEMPEPKRRYQLLDLERWAASYGVPFRFPSRFPMNTVKALRLALVCPEERQLDLVHAIFAALWAEDRDISNEEELRAICSALSLDVGPLFAKVGASETKAVLRAGTDDAERRGIFGVPTFVVGDELFWGQDRIELVERAILRA
ncbi:MAG: 2-hydroxychromene-2-carboxylate isomerase [Polyangiaceae bacterium]|nr:2-hydroxychromene-2-carboxylate isomerase [Polyangiaceae bacterium]